MEYFYYLLAILALAAVFGASGFAAPARALPLISEVFYDGRWHMYDNSMSAIYTLCDGVTVAGVEVGDLLVLVTFGDELQDFPFPLSESFPRGANGRRFFPLQQSVDNRP